ncbi:MAG: hypothetical protein V2I33_20680, partial [Kangiellaceae bacterium]|nr:hypothetical protein [Kangiellaceae bacterium]
ETPEKVWTEFEALITAYLDQETGYTARRALSSVKDHGDYDQLARFGEWDVSDTPTPEDIA